MSNETADGIITVVLFLTTLPVVFLINLVMSGSLILR